MMRVLITGITGFAGSHLAEYLLEQDDVEIFGTMRWRSRLDNLDDIAARGKLHTLEETPLSGRGGFDRRVVPGAVHLVECDLCDPTATRHVIGAIRPDRIFHLAAQTFVFTSWQAPSQTMQTNIIGQVNLFEAIRSADIQPRVHVAGSSEEYGLIHENELPVRETNPLRPLSPYAVSKVAQEMLAHQYHWSYGLHTIVTRAFNHTGPRQGHVLVTSSVARQIAEIETSVRAPCIEVGDLESQRDWTDVRDAVRGYWMALEGCTPGEPYNIATGQARTIREMLDVVLSFTSQDIEVRSDPDRYRPSDLKLLCGDSSKFRQATGWAPTIPFSQTMRDLLDYWRGRVNRGRA